MEVPAFQCPSLRNTGFFYLRYSSSIVKLIKEEYRWYKARTSFSGEQLQGEVYEKADMQNSHFDGVNLAESRFYAVLANALFTDSNMQAARFENVNLGEAVFDDVNMAGVVFGNINLSGVTINNAKLTGMTIDGVLVTELLAAFEARNG